MSLYLDKFVYCWCKNVNTEEFSCAIHTSIVIIKAQQHLYFLSNLKRARLLENLMNFTWCTAEQTSLGHRGQQLRSKVNVGPWASNIICNPTHPAHLLFKLLPSGRRHTYAAWAGKFNQRLLRFSGSMDLTCSTQTSLQKYENVSAASWIHCSRTGNIIDKSTTTSNRTCLIVYIHVPLQNQAISNLFSRLQRWYSSCSAAQISYRWGGCHDGTIQRQQLHWCEKTTLIWWWYIACTTTWNLLFTTQWRKSLIYSKWLPDVHWLIVLHSFLGDPNTYEN